MITFIPSKFPLLDVEYISDTETRIDLTRALGYAYELLVDNAPEDWLMVITVNHAKSGHATNFKYMFPKDTTETPQQILGNILGGLLKEPIGDTPV